MNAASWASSGIDQSSHVQGERVAGITSLRGVLDTHCTNLEELLDTDGGGMEQFGIC